MSKTNIKYSEALQELFIPKLKEFAEKSRLTTVDCDEAIIMLNAIKRALELEEAGFSLL